MSRPAPRPLLILPAEGAPGLDPAAPPEVGIAIGDLAEALARAGITDRGAAVSPAEVFALVEELRQGTAAGTTQVVRLIARLYERLTAHVEFAARAARVHAVDVIAADVKTKPVPARSRHGQDLQLRAQRTAVSLVAADLALAPGTLWRDIAIVRRLADLPVATAAASQGALGFDKVRALTDAWGQVPDQLRGPATERGLVRIAVDAPDRQTRRHLAASIAPLIDRANSRDLAQRVAQRASISAHPLGGGLAELRIIDRAEHIGALLTAAHAGARTWAHHGITGRIGELRTTVLAELAKQALRTGQIPTPFGTPLPLQGYRGRPARLRVIERPPLLRVAAGPARTTWSIPGVDALTPTQVDSLRDDPTWDHIVEFIPLLAPDDPAYLAAARQLSCRHDPTPTQRRYLFARDGGQCRAHFCDDPSPPDDAHHVELFTDTGRTELSGLISLHSRCHRIIHDAWVIRLTPDGTAHFTDHDGNTWTTKPPGIRPTDGSPHTENHPHTHDPPHDEEEPRAGDLPNSDEMPRAEER